jgi:glycerol-3-phosphate O-acyltransferase
MDKKSTPEISIQTKHQKILAQFCESYKKAVGDASLPILELFAKLLKKQKEDPFIFEPYHQKVRSPIDYYKFSLDFFRPLIDFSQSKIFGLTTFKKIKEQLKRKENCILLANHQSEADPQIISLLLEKEAPEIAEKIIYVAGERVVTDPLAIPFSMGCDLLCIYSKRYIDHPPELKSKKQLHNKNTMELMSRLLQEGGQIIYVAPSGGRDRKNAKGIIEVAPFDPQSLEMFYLMARKAKTPTHFYPFALSTYDILPPPETIQKELGEVRVTKRGAAKIAFNAEFDMEKFPGFEHNDKTLRRQARADAIWNIVNKEHEEMT